MPQSHLQTDILYIKCTNTKLVVTHVCVLSCVRLFVTPWTVIPPSMGFSRQEYWSGLPFPIPGDFLKPGIKPAPLLPSALADLFCTCSLPGKPLRSSTSVPLEQDCLGSSFYTAFTSCVNWFQLLPAVRVI